MKRYDGKDTLKNALSALRPLPEEILYELVAKWLLRPLPGKLTYELVAKRLLRPLPEEILYELVAIL